MDNMNKNSLKFVIVGHVDHGKSTLIGRLLFDTDSLPPDRMEEIKKSSKSLGRKTEFAFIMDHFQEEREQGITIDTSQTFFQTKQRDYVIIDAPGHVEFIKNMITGASQAQTAILIVDIEEGIKEQTRRHTKILSLLGIKNIIVVFNKMDLIGFEKSVFEKIQAEIRKLLENLNINAKHFIPISASNGDNVVKKSKNMNWYKGVTVLEGLELIENNISDKDDTTIAIIQDIYKTNQERMVICKIEKGKLVVNQKIKILPENKITQIKSINIFNETRKKAFTGESIGLTINDPLFLERGNIICDSQTDLNITNEFKANVFWLSKDNLEINENITIRCATQEIIAKIIKINKRLNSSSLELIEKNGNTIKNLEIGEVIIETKKPIVIEKFDKNAKLGRFVIVKNNIVSAGGIVI